MWAYTGVQVLALRLKKYNRPNIFQQPPITLVCAILLQRATQSTCQILDHASTMQLPMRYDIGYYLSCSPSVSKQLRIVWVLQLGARSLEWVSTRPTVCNPDPLRCIIAGDVAVVQPEAIPPALSLLRAIAMIPGGVSFQSFVAVAKAAFSCSYCQMTT